MKEIPKDNVRKGILSKENSLDRIPVKQTVFVQTKIKKKTLDDLGEIEEAKKHRSASRPLHKIKELNNNVNFCRCCNLPCEEKGIIERFHYCDNIDKFSECGLGITFYFYFFRFLMVVLFISICAIIISMMVFNKHYTKGINRVCNNSYKKIGENNITFCEGFVTEAEEDLNIYARFIKDWVLTFSSDNIKIYYLLHDSLSKNNENAEDVVINYSLLNFYLLITLFVLNIFYIILINARAKLIKLKKMNYLSIRDYTVLISNMKSVLIDYHNKMREQNPGYIYKSQILIENKSDFVKYIENYIKADKSLNDLQITNINICFNLGQYMELRDELQICKKKIFKIKNNAHIIKINSDKGYLIEDRRFYYLPFEDFEIYCIKWENKPLSVLEKEKKDLDQKISLEIKKLQEISETNFTGYLFVSFEYIKDKEKILENYPHHFFDIVVDFFKNIKYYLCCCCVSKGQRIKFNKIKGIDVTDPQEPEDIIWENFQYSKLQRFYKIILYFFICILTMAVSFGIVLGFTYWQNKIIDNEKNTNNFGKYLLSLLITIIISILNMVLEYILEIFTKLEKHLSRTNYYLSLSVKDAIFTFLNSAVVPLLAKQLAVKKRIKEIKYNIDRNNLIVDDMFVMFLVNAFITPIFWTLRVPYYINKFKIYLLEKRKNPDKHHYKTQKELNDLYEYPNMNISYKYAYLVKTTAMTFFYLPIFPIGFIISFLGFVLGYLLELYNFTHFYKRPEMLDESISKAYANNFIIVLFIGGVGDLFFFYEIVPSKAMSLVNFILFLVLIFVPYTKFLKCNFIGEKKKSEYFPKPLSEVYLDFYSDYERLNPFTKGEGFKHYLFELKKKGLLSDNALNEAIENIDKLNLMEIYYGISRGNIPLIHQSVMANTNNNSLAGKNLSIRKSLVNADIRESQLEIKKKQEYMDYLINSIFGKRQSLQIIEEEVDKFPMDTIDEESDTKERLVHAYNNPLAINLGLGPLPMDQNIYQSVPISISKMLSNDNIVSNSLQDFQKKNSEDIQVKINNDIKNYRNRKINEDNKNENKNSLNNEISETSFVLGKNISIPNQNLADSESKEINNNMPFKASIHQSQNEINNNTNAKSSMNSLDKNNINNNETVKVDTGKIPLDTIDHNFNRNSNKESSDNSNNVSKNFENIFDMDSSQNKIVDKNKFIIDKFNFNNKNANYFEPQDEVSNKNNKENINIYNNNENDINNINDKHISKSTYNENINLDNNIEHDSNLSKSSNNENIKIINVNNDNNNNEQNNEEESEDST